MKTLKTVVLVVSMLVVALFVGVGPAVAQINSGVASVALSMSVPESLTVSATPAALTFTYNSAQGTATASGPISVTTTVNLASTRTSLNIYTYFSSSSALTNGSVSIPSSDVFVAYSGPNMTPVACTSTDPFSSNGCGILGTWNNPTQFTNTTTATMTMNGLLNLAPGTFTGVLNIQAQAQ